MVGLLAPDVEWVAAIPVVDAGGGAVGRVDPLERGEEGGQVVGEGGQVVDEVAVGPVAGDPLVDRPGEAEVGAGPAHGYRCGDG